jgi:hypothetical protein
MTITKPKGWKGAKGDRYWYKDSRSGQRVMCSSCGKAALGTLFGVPLYNHFRTCPRMGAEQTNVHTAK